MRKNDYQFAFNQILMLVLPFAFYLAFFFIDGYVICADSSSYIDMNFTREPLYPMYLAFFRLFSGTSDTYLQLAVLGQSLFAAFATWNVAKYLSEKFNLNSLYILGVTALPLLSSLLCRFAAKRSSMYSNSIMTEGLTISIYLLFIRYVLEYVLSKSRSSFIWCCILSFIGISIRKQMFILLFLFVAVYIYINKPKKNTFGKTFILLATIILSSVLLDCSYNYVVRGQFTRHKDAGRFPTTIAMYAAEEEYADYIEEPELKDIFLMLYHICDNEGWLMHSAPSGWFDAVSHFEDHYDFIQLDTMETILTREISNYQYKAGEMLDIERIDLIEKEFRNALLPHEIPRLLTIFFNNILAGLVLSVAKKSHMLVIYSVFVYMFYLLLMAIVIYKSKQNSRSANHSHLVAASALSVITLLSILGNVGLVSMVIFCQTRYTIYNLSLFYISLLIMIKVLLENRKKN